ncbi:MAG: ATP synthase F0 subunit B [Deltaproteobacteria bacterium]|nr:ATP synthase F0 subunit B [Deltaproteobacteria bacterium]
MISLDITLIYPIFGLLILTFILNRLLFGPLIKVLKERDERISGATKKAAEMEKSVEKGLLDYEKRLKEATARGHEERNRLLSEALEREKEILDSSRASAAEELSGMKIRIEESKKSALASLIKDSAAISREMAEKVLERKVIVMLLTLGLCALPALGLAAEGEHHEGNSGLLWMAVNFAVLVIGIVILWVKVLSGLLDNRAADIKKAMEDAHAAKEAAEKKSVEYREKLSLLEKRIAEIQESLRAEGEAEKKRIIAETEASAVKFKEQARAAAEQEVKKARIEIRGEIAGIAAGMAEEILKKELKNEDQERIIKGYIDNLRLN